jgi:hypothetical protein
VGGNGEPQDTPWHEAKPQGWASRSHPGDIKLAPPATGDQKGGAPMALDGFGYGATLRLRVGLTSFVPPALTLWRVLIRQKEMAASGLI